MAKKKNMPKRTLTDDQKKVRNEKARRRRALAFACRRVPIELEREIFSYMKNPRHGRVEVGMTWQKHPTAELIGAAPSVLRAWHDGCFSYITDQHVDWHEKSYITHLAQMLAKYPHGYTLAQCKLKFTPRMQLTIARKAFDIAYSDILSFDFKIMPCGLHYQRKAAILKLEGLIELGDWRRDLLEWFISPQRPWFLGETWPVWWPGPHEFVIDEHFHWNSQRREALTKMGHRLRDASNPEVALQDLKMALKDLR